jgi:pilus assembly protein CpaC
LDALDQEGLGTILAEPNLVAISGETASFLVGGEFPYPVPQDQNITIEFKQFGMSLSFTPTVLNSNMINLRVRPEVSELDNQNSISVPVGSGSSVVSVPGLKTRRAETSVELGDGQSLAIAGLISSKIANSYSSLPGLDSIPILGALFRSTKFQRDQTELVIIVTPYVIKPASRTKDLSVPTEVKSATAVETLFTGRLNRVEKTTAVNCKGNCFYGAAGFNVNE